jgi:serine/threonine protein kinase/SH3-like domain-containing protein
MSIENLIGQTFGQCELRELLGVGGMGAVYRAYQKSLKREVAVKVISTALSQQSGYRERFFREAETAAALEDAHIIPIYDFGTQGQISYLIMRLLTGGSLAEHLKQRSTLPSLGEVAHLLGQLASALDYAHSQGVIHRDIKPSNIMFDHKGTAFIVDFGVAHLAQATTVLTGTGTTLGTPLYMPPEQWRNENLSPAADQYALAVMAYQLVTGQVPFAADTPYGLMHKHLNEMPTPPQHIRAGVPQAVATVLNRAMAKNPEQRFSNITAFVQAFQRAVAGSEGAATGYFTAKLQRIGNTARPISSSRPSASMPVPLHRQPALWVAGSIIVLLIVALALALLPHETLAVLLTSSPIPSEVSIISTIPTGGDNSSSNFIQPTLPAPTLVAVNAPNTPDTVSLQIASLTAVLIEAQHVEQTSAAQIQNQQVTGTAQAILVTLQAAQDRATSVAQTATQLSVTFTPTATVAQSSFQQLPTVEPLPTQAVIAAPANPVPVMSSTLIPTQTPILPTPTNILSITLLAVTSTPIPVEAVITSRSANIRSGPGTAYSVLQTAFKDMSFAAIGQYNRGAWYQIQLPDGRLAWIAASVAQLTDPQYILPVITNIPPVPTSMPQQSSNQGAVGNTGTCTPGTWQSACGSNNCPSDNVSQCNADGTGWICVWDPGTCSNQSNPPSNLTLPCPVSSTC